MTENNQNLENYKIIPYFQPIFNVRKNLIDKHECLVRLVDDQDHILTPDLFLETFKKQKRYPLITRKMINDCFAVFKNRDEAFSINLCIEDLNTPSTMEFIKEKVLNYPDPNKIIFEIVEFDDLEDIKVATQFILKCQEWGCQIAMDDFGDGAIRLEDLEGLPIDYLKIEGQLIKKICSDEKVKVQVEHIVDFCFARKIATIAERVEDQEIYVTAMRLGVQNLQGYFIGEPSPDPITTFDLPDLDLNPST
jgi:c-di-GMP phosphodiesterase